MSMTHEMADATAEKDNNKGEEFDLDEMIENRKCINCLHAAVISAKIYCFFHPG